MNAHTRAEALRLVDEIEDEASTRYECARQVDLQLKAVLLGCNKLRALLSASDDVPDGYVLVPKVATEVMLEAARDWQRDAYVSDPLGCRYRFYDGVYRTMLAAAQRHNGDEMSDEIERLRAEVVALREQYDGIEEERNAMDAVQDRAEKAESALAALRKRIEKAPVALLQEGPAPKIRGFFDE